MRLIKWSFGLIITLVVLIAVAPIAGKHFAIYWFEQRGYQSDIDTVSFNPITGALTIAGLDIRKSKAQGLRIDLLEAHIKLKELFDKELVIRRARTQGLRLDIGSLETDFKDFSGPIESFVNKHMPAWRFEIINSLNEHAELCRTGTTADGKALSQCFSIGSFALRDATVQNTSKGWQLSTRSTSHLQRMYFKDHFNGTSLLYLGDAQIRDIVADQSERRIGQVVLKSFHLVERSEIETQRLDTPYQTQINSLLINDIVETRSPEQIRLQLGLVDATALRQTLHKDRNAAFVIVERLREVFPSLEMALTKEDDDGPTVIVEVMKTRIIDGGIAWLDDSVSPPAKESLTGLSLELGPVSSAQPEKRSPVTFLARLGDGGEIYLRGQLAPFAEYPNFSVEGHVKGLDLAKVSAYTETLFAERVMRGRLDAKFRAEGLASNVQGDAAMRLSDIATGGATGSGGTMSLQNAFTRLKDKNQAVDFDVFFNLDLLKVDSLGEALGRHVKRTLSRLANGEQPAPRSTGPQEPQGMTFEPLKYNPNANELIGTQAIRFRDILIVAQEHPRKTLFLCPVTTGGEWAALYRQGKPLKSWEQVPSVEQQHLLDMSTLRSKILSKALVDAGINRNRVEICEPTIQLSEGGPSFLTAELK
ncbi:MAG TPA: DUF748 domain-containing protein [Marinagarivorans sp.]